MGDLTQEQLENIQIDYGIIYADYGEVTQKQLGPTRGGGEFKAIGKIKEIEVDGIRGKAKGLQYYEEINAALIVKILDTTLETLALAMPHADLSAGVLKNTTGGVIIPATKYLKNITMFAKVTGGGYKKITLYNAMNENDFQMAAKPKGESEIALEVWAHWDPANPVDLYKIEDVGTLTTDTTKPTATTTPADAATGVVVSANLTALFSEAIRTGDIISDNFLLIKASDGTIIAGALTYDAGTLTATFNPTSDLNALTAYIWTISRVRDNAGNVMNPKVVNFTTA